MSMPLHSEGNRTDFTFDGKTLIGQVIAVIEGPVVSGYQCEHQYIIQDSGGKRYRVMESNVSTPYGENDD
jgi:hypothetical protein